MTEEQILRLLMKKHEADVAIPHCQTGCSKMYMDLWVMPKSWVRPSITAYEIKCSRSDFLRDDKWPKYMEYCNRFAFVAPPGIIDPAELADGIGLFVTSTNGTRLYTKRSPALRNEQQIPEDVFRYVLMRLGSTTIEHEAGCAQRIGGACNCDAIRFWQEWMAGKEDLRTLGYRASTRVRQAIEGLRSGLERENKKLKAENEMLADVRRILDSLGVEHAPSWDRRRTIESALANAGGRDVLNLIDGTSRALSTLRAELSGDMGK